MSVSKPSDEDRAITGCEPSVVVGAASTSVGGASALDLGRLSLCTAVLVPPWIGPAPLQRSTL